jgi:uncharacterized protein
MSDDEAKARRDAVAQAVLDSWGSAFAAMSSGNGGVGMFSGWQNRVTGLGMPGADKSVHSHYLAADPTNTQENQEIWRGDPMGRRIVETIPNEMLREGFRIVIEGDVPNAKELQKDITAFWEDLGLSQALWLALCYERAYGGGAILMGVNDLQTMNLPLDLTKAHTFDWLTVVEPIELQAIRWQTDPQQRDFGMPSMYRLNPITPGGAKLYGVEVHNSRVVVFPGIRVSRRQVTTQAGWGDAILTSCIAPLRDFRTAHQAAAVLANDFSQSVFKMKGLSEIISMDKDKELVNRMRAMDISRSVVRAVLIDADEEFERKSTPLTGLPDLLDRFSTILAAAADMPLTLLMGQSPAGLNATGESDIRFFYDRVKAMQQRRLRPAVEQIVRVIMAVLEMNEPDSWSIQFAPLWQPTELEQSQARFTQSQTDEKYITLSVISSDEVRRSRFGGDQYTYDTQLDAGVTELATQPLGEEGAPKYPDLAPQTTAPPTDPTIPEESAYSNDPSKVVLTAETPTGEDVESVEPVPSPAGAKIPVRERFRARPTVRPTSDEFDTSDLHEDLMHTDDLANDYITRLDRIQRRGEKYYIMTEDGSKQLGGPYDSEKQANDRLGEIEYFKSQEGKS